MSKNKKTTRNETFGAVVQIKKPTKEENKSDSTKDNKSSENKGDNK